ncbi:hypothetical protein RvY_15069-2 [Ramazzottius varieornatus]|uniref:EGF-like domain-containing protein n=1 Tax=Ramazzottius varieornatus TaxID=947166 RepID=A0A1D1VTK1_RAMVA|nr:hypothetical protein RvY_15069-2 [Ramazzottius varieornatus]
MDNSAATTERRKTFRNLSVVILFCSLLGCCLLEAAFASDGEKFEAAFQGQCPRGASDGICQHICRNHSPRTFACYCLPGFHLQHNGYACTNETESLTAAPTSTMIQSFSVLRNIPQDKFALEALSARQNRCSEVKCRNGGWCDEGNKEDATCSCPLGRTGKYCHQRTSFSTPHFSGRSSAMLSLLANRRNGSRFDIVVTIRPESPDGLFFFVGHNLESNTKLIVLSLVDAYVILRILLGDNTIVIQSRSRVKLNETLHVEAGRKSASDFYLRVGLQELQMISKPEVDSKELDLAGNVYIGGVPDSNTLQQEILRQDYAESRKLFRGCIVRLAIDGKAFVLQPPPFGDIVDGINVDRCNDIITDDSTEEPPCRTECLNGGRCIRSNDGQESFCDCAAGFVGLQCEIGTFCFR